MEQYMQELQPSGVHHRKNGGESLINGRWFTDFGHLDKGNFIDERFQTKMELQSYPAKHSSVAKVFECPRIE